MPRCLEEIDAVREGGNSSSSSVAHNFYTTAPTKISTGGGLGCLCHIVGVWKSLINSGSKFCVEGGLGIKILMSSCKGACIESSGPGGVEAVYVERCVG